MRTHLFFAPLFCTFGSNSRIRLCSMFCVLAVIASTVGFTVGLTACRPPVDPPPALPPIAGTTGAFILCQGLFMQDNSALSRFDAASGLIIPNFFTQANPTLRLGDTANNMLLKGDTLYVAVSTSRTIEILRASTGVWLGRIRLAQGQDARKLTIVNDTTGFVSTYADAIVEFNPRTFQVRGVAIPVGPAPEGIASTEQYVFVANSGFGDFRAREPKAGTISVVNWRTRQEIRTLAGVPNVTELTLNRERTRLYAGYAHLPMLRDSVGGIVEFDATTLQELRRWRVRNPSALALTPRGDTLLCLGTIGTATGVVRILLSSSLSSSPPAQPEMLIGNTTHNSFWYGLGYNPASGDMWIADARNFTVAGAVIILRQNGSIVRQFDVGINPSTFVFF